MLRGSFILVLSEEHMNYFDKIAKEAFMEVMSLGIVNVTERSNSTNTVHLKTDPGGIQNKRPGVYLVQTRDDGFCIIGQTKDLKVRFNQYTNRSSGAYSATNKINKNFYNAVQKAMNKNLAFSQIIQRFVVYTWVDKNGVALDIDASLLLKNQMNYLEHRLILAFFECGLCFNINDVAPQLMGVPLEIESPGLQPGEINTQPDIGPHQAKPFKVNGLYFFSGPNYEKYRASLSEDEKNRFPARPTLRLKLAKAEGEITSDIRYLTIEEIQDVQENNLFWSPEW